MLLILISITTFVFSQSSNVTLFNYIINYQLKYKLNSTQKDYKIDNYVLFINNNSSLFRPTGYAILDSMELTKEYKNLPQDQRIGIAMKYASGVDNIIITSLKTNVVEYTEYASYIPSSPRYTETVLPKWKLKNETKKINGIDCKKAIRSLFGRSWTAWYSTDYILPFGPYKFFGLPGLIVRIEDQTQSYIFEISTSIIHRNRFQPTLVHQKVANMSKAEALNIYYNNRFSMAMFEGAKMDPAIYKKLQDRVTADKKNYNNPIELKPFEYH